MENFTCQICMERFDDNIRVPYLLNCGHTFCKECLKIKLYDFGIAQMALFQSDTLANRDKLKDKQKCFISCPESIMTKNFEELLINK